MISTVAFLFPGQGSQIVGMGAELAAQSPSAKAVFEQVNDAISEDLFSIMKQGPAEILQLTPRCSTTIAFTRSEISLIIIPYLIAHNRHAHL